MKKRVTIGSAIVAVVCLIMTPPIYEGFKKAEVNLSAPVECRVGELVVLDASESKMDSITWNIQPATTNFKIIDGGKQAIFSSEKIGNYVITVAVVNGKKVDLSITKLSVYGLSGELPLPIQKLINTDGIKSLIDEQIPAPVKQVINFDQVKNMIDTLVPNDNRLPDGIQLFDTTPDQCDPNDPDCCPKDELPWLPQEPDPPMARVIKSLNTLINLMDRGRFETDDEFVQAALWGVERATKDSEAWAPFAINFRKYLEESKSQSDSVQRIKNVLNGLNNAKA